MNLIVWLVVGGVIGWLASLIMKTDGQQGIFLNIVVGLVGATLAGWLISPMLGVPNINDNVFSFGSLLVSLLGAVILLALVQLVRGRPRV
ncbi:MAG: GlsB/YeaQ/YmgE family stress response membrane protein [Acidobacteriota bacterium]